MLIMPVDPIGVALGVPGVVALLVQTGLSGYQIFSDVQDLDKDLEDFQH
jgi:hypothetical protein